MSRRREVFHIEELTGMRAAPTAVEPSAEAALRHAEVMTELRSLREAIGAHDLRQAAPLLAAKTGAFKSEPSSIHDAVQRTKQEIATLVLTSFTNPDMGRVSQELNAAVGGTEIRNATHPAGERGDRGSRQDACRRDQQYSGSEISRATSSTR